MHYFSTLGLVSLLLSSSSGKTMFPILILGIISIFVIVFFVGLISIVARVAERKRGSLDSEDNGVNYFIWFGLFAVAILVIWLLYLVYWAEVLRLVFPDQKFDLDRVGQLGDGFGAATSLFSGLGFAGLLGTLIMQRHELKLQRQEIRNSTFEFGMQRFETTLFSILGLFTDHISSLELLTDRSDEGEQNGDLIKGRAVLDYFASELPNEVANIIDDDLTDADKLVESYSFAEQRDSYEVLYEMIFEGDLGPYFRLLYHALRHIDDSNLNDEEKHKYSKIVRSHLNSSELKLLMFNFNSNWGEGFRDRIRRYEILKHINPADRVLNPSLAEMVGPKAFARH